jgi:nucleolar protein TMA23
MDAHALLTSQGWRGSGNSLHPTDNSIGLSKPLLVSRKQNNLGIGKKAHRTSDMWWMNAFDSSLKGLDTSKEGQVVQTVTSGGLDMVARGGAKWVGGTGGLYASFVRGECLSGTITPEESSEMINGGGKKRKREDEKEETKEERRARRKAKKAMAEEQVAALEKEAKKSELKAERRAQKATKRALKEQESKAAAVEVQSAADTTEKSETKEERRERRRLKKLAKETRESSTEDTGNLKEKKPKK